MEKLYLHVLCRSENNERVTVINMRDKNVREWQDMFNISRPYVQLQLNCATLHFKFVCLDLCENVIMHDYNYTKWAFLDV